MNWKWFILLLLIAFGLTIALGIFVPVDALNPVLLQGDVAYLSETVDLSRTIAWPDNELAWCSDGDIGCSPPDQVIQIEGYMYSYYLDPAVWHLGTYYKWDGQWNRGEYSVAFTIKPGTRPVTNETIPAENVTNETVIPNVTLEGPYHYLVARGDDPLITVRIARDDNAHLWMFGATSQVIDYPMVKDGFDYSYQMKTTDTFSQTAGKYSGYLQFDGKNGMQDVKWDNTTKCLSTPYRTSLQKDVCPNVWNPANVKMEFENLVKTGYNSDDILIPVTMEVKEPEIIVTELSLGETKIWVQGRTTWSDGTTLTFKLDPNNYALAQEIRLHTWNTTIEGNLTDYRTFSIACPLTPEELYVGIHELKMSVTKNGFTTDMFYNFRRTDTYVLPTPTPKVVAILTDMNGTRITPVKTPIPIPAPINTVTVEPTTAVTTATPVIVTTQPTESPQPTPTKMVTAAQTTIPTIPLTPLLCVAALVGMIAWRRLK